MPTSIEAEHPIEADLSLTKILLAESDPVEIDRLKAKIDREFPTSVFIVKTYPQLIESVAREKPKLVILGNIGNSNYSEIAKACHKIQPHLPILLLSSQGIIIDSFRKLVKTCGLTDVIYRDSDRLNQTIAAVIESPQQQTADRSPASSTAQPDRESVLPAEPIVKLAQPTTKPLTTPATTNKIILAGLAEIVTVSNNYFGPLAQGNYWRKSHSQLIDKFPALQNWSADHFGNLGCQESILEQELTDEDLQGLRAWIQLFIEECERIIIDYKMILYNSNLSTSAKDLLPTI
jgi:DNA-binding NarL/FixJ family response regulator